MSSVPGSHSSGGGRPVAEQLGLVVVTHNSAGVLPAFISSLANASQDSIAEIVFVDNASTDASIDLVRRKLAQATILANKQNVGFATAVNQGVRATHTDLIVVVNPDAAWLDGTLSHLARFLRDHPQAAAVCPRLVYPDGRPQSSIRRFPTHANVWLSRQSPVRFLRHLFPARSAYTVDDPVEPARVESIAATCMLIRRSAFAAVGGMDEGYFLYVEDTDLCKRWHNSGYEVWIDPTAAVTHDWQGGSGNATRLRRHHRNGIRRYFRTHHADKPIRNAILSMALSVADGLDRLSGDTVEERQ